MGREARLRKAGITSAPASWMRNDEVQAFLAAMTFHHEGAHVAVARHFGLEAEIVEPPPEKPDWAASASHEAGTNRQNAMISLAGEVVEEMIEGHLYELGRKAVREGVEDGGITDDQKHALVWCLRETEGDAGKAVGLANDLLRETRDLVIELWPTIMVIAKAAA